MSLGYYRLIKGKLTVHEKQSPDGDSMRFIADDMLLFKDLPHYTAPSGAGEEKSYQLRFQAIDTPELHYGSAVQPHGLESRNGLLTWLGINPSDWDWAVAPSEFQWEKSAAILTDGFELHGRPIAFVLKSLDYDDGSDIKLTKKILEQTYNFDAVKTGLAYLGLYSGGLSHEIESSFIAAYKGAKEANLGIWRLDQTKRFTVNTLEDLSPGGGSLIYPKIFRRCVDALRWAGGEFKPGSDLDDFLQFSPNEDDHFIVHTEHGGHVKSRLSDVLEQVNNQIKIEVDLNTVEFISK